jgi:hypothetical protein
MSQHRERYTNKRIRAQVPNYQEYLKCALALRPAGDGRAPEAVREIRIDDPSGKDTAGAVRAAQSRSNPADPRTAPTSREFRPPGVYALLGSIAEWELGGEAHDVEEPVSSWVTGVIAMVSSQSASRDNDPAPETESKTEGALRVLRHHWQLQCAGTIPKCGHRNMEALAIPSPTGS